MELCHLITSQSSNAKFARGPSLKLLLSLMSQKLK